ncbi:hypothetical protein EI555_008657, partial [Monodon monoceros]
RHDPRKLPHPSRRRAPAPPRRPAPPRAASGRSVYPRCMVGSLLWTTRAVRSGCGGGMHQASAPSAPLASPDYYERLGRLQHGLRDSEKKRLDLEGKLYEYNQSDTR